MSKYVDSLEPGDFLYQSDSELFLVVVENNENNVKMAAHGWRTIDKGRLDEYISHENGKLYREKDVAEMISRKANARGEDVTKEDLEAKLEEIKEIFDVYGDEEMDTDVPTEDFALEDT